MAGHRRRGSHRRLARAGAAGLSCLAKLHDAAGARHARVVHLCQLRQGLRRIANLPPACQFAAVRRWCGVPLPLARHGARLAERAHRHAVQILVLCAFHRTLGDSGHLVRRRLDHAGQPPHRSAQSFAAACAGHGSHFLRRVHAPRHDVGRRHSARADRVSFDECCFSFDGSVAGGSRVDERGFDIPNGAPDHAALGVACAGRFFPHSVRAFHRILRESGASGIARRHRSFHLFHLRSAACLSERCRACLHLCGDAARHHRGRQSLGSRDFPGTATNTRSSAARASGRG